MHLLDVFPSTRRAVRNTRDDVRITHERLDALNGRIDQLIQTVESLQRTVRNVQEQADIFQHTGTGIIQRLNETELNIKESVNDIARATASLGDDMAKATAYGSKAEMLLWELYRAEGEDRQASRERFFHSLPPATGSLRLLQLSCAKLMGEFDALCRKHDIDYWLDFGSLLGAARHSGFIPWDDDTDVSMMRDDIERLIAIVQDEPRYAITVLYDPYVLCRQIRFVYADTNVPCFVDLFVYDKARESSQDEWLWYKGLREEMIKELATSPWYEKWLEEGCVSEESEFGKQAASIMNRYADRVAARTKNNGAEGVVYTIDNMTPISSNNPRIYPKDMLFPMKDMDFEGETLRCPADIKSWLQSVYGDWLSLPNDIDSHFQHISDESLYGANAISKMKELLAENRDAEPSARDLNQLSQQD